MCLFVGLLINGLWLTSLRYHCLHPNYIHERLQQLGNSYELRVLLVVVDVVSVSHTVMHCCIFMIGNQYQ
jgi:DNA repair protein Rad10